MIIFPSDLCSSTKANVKEVNHWFRLFLQTTYVNRQDYVTIVWSSLSQLSSLSSESTSFSLLFFTSEGSFSSGGAFWIKKNIESLRNKCWSYYYDISCAINKVLYIINVNMITNNCTMPWVLYATLPWICALSQVSNQSFTLPPPWYQKLD